MEDQQKSQAAQAEQEENAPIAVAMIKFTDNADGTMSIDATHSGQFEAMYQSHACLRAVTQFLPQVCAPVGTRISGDTGIKVPISDGDRYQALRTLAMVSDEVRAVIMDQISAHDPQSEMDYDIMADKMVEICRGMATVPVVSEAGAADAVQH